MDLWDILTVTDWISPALALAQDAINGPSHTLMIPIDCGWRGHDIANVLRDQGINTWGHMIVNGNFMITVQAADADDACNLLAEYGIATE
jgi:hypothetical protein